MQTVCNDPSAGTRHVSHCRKILISVQLNSLSDLSRLSKVYPGDISLLSNCSCFVGLHSLTQTPHQAQGAGEDRAVYHGGESRAVVLFPTI